jgi:2-polyprenyl-3-methyl-5-hydroxy-6-metoxy-1,4-benzoquinol methylase
MFQEIIDLARQSDYDFRGTACPDDHFAYLFDEWVPYYRSKWAVSRCLQPAKILEIGVRYGYSALAFLNACPTADYIGIDLDSDSYGGAKGAICWAESKLQGYSANLIVANSQSLDRFPGGTYDLIHIDGQQDQAGFLHDLELALGQAKHILVDGYFWTQSNFLAASEFLFRNRDLIEFYGVIPGYAGELLIVTKGQSLISGGTCESSEQIREAYDGSYYLGDCGGFDSFKRTGGLKLEDPRLRTVLQLATLAPLGRALDVGCGRGELSIALARSGFDVTGVDYSAAAIELARSVRDTAGELASRVSFLCEDVTRVALDGLYDVAVAADVIEHLAPSELDRLYRAVAGYLRPEGLFVIHTFPNSWYYRYGHARNQRIARSVGAYLPLNPRSRYEQLMHINEQSPRTLRRQLKQYFPHVLVWFSDHDVCKPYENLVRRFSIAEMRQSGDLFALAANRPLDPVAIAEHFRMEPLTNGDLTIQALDPPQSVAAGSVFMIRILVKNGSPAPLRSCPPNPVHLSYHWLDAASGHTVVFDGERTTLDPSLGPGIGRRYDLFVRAPTRIARHRLRMTIVQEYIRWFDTPPYDVFVDSLIDVK